jgi:2-isopropylmalate synthase
MSLIYDWNQIGAPPVPPKVLLADETLRDGLQSASVRCPTIDEKIEVLHLMEALGLVAADVGLPGAGPHVVADVERLVREIDANRMRIAPYCAARTVLSDIRPIVDIVQRTGRPIEVAAFIGSSHIRQYVEDWTVDFLERAAGQSVEFAVGERLPVLFVTEDTTRAHPDTLRRLYTAAIRAGATRLCVADTVGHATPTGAAAVTRFVRGIVDELGTPEVELDWHGHRDRGFAVLNSMAALEAGATRVHATALGVGERVGNTPMDLLLVNLVMMGYVPSRDLVRLGEYCEVVARCYQVNIPPNYPVFGRDAFRTATGVHAAAIAKAYHKQDHSLADTVYSSVPARLVGREQEVEIGPMSGRSNVTFWLMKRGLPVSDAIVEGIFTRAKEATAVLAEEELRAIVAALDPR